MLESIQCVAIDFGGTLTPPGTGDDHDGTPVDPRAADAVRTLHRGGVRLVLASNTTETNAPTRRPRLAEAGILDCFAELILSSYVKHRKPEAAFYKLVEQAAGCPPEQVLFAGNRVEADVLGPRAAGMSAVLVSSEPAPPDNLPGDVPVLGRLAGLPALLGRTGGTQ